MISHEQHVGIIDEPAVYDDFNGLKILSPKGVYHTHAYSSTRDFLSVLPDVNGLDVLELGGGTGAIALSIRRSGARKVVATDISQRACAAMECNALLNGIEVEVRQGDLFSPLLPGERFDLVVFNQPLMNKEPENDAEISLCDPNGDLLSRFLQGLPKVIKPRGSALFGHATISAPLPNHYSGYICTLSETNREDGKVFRVLGWQRHI